MGPKTKSFLTVLGFLIWQVPQWWASVWSLGSSEPFITALRKAVIRVPSSWVEWITTPLGLLLLTVIAIGTLQDKRRAPTELAGPIDLRSRVLLLSEEILLFLLQNPETQRAEGVPQDTMIRFSVSFGGRIIGVRHELVAKGLTDSTLDQVYERPNTPATARTAAERLRALAYRLPEPAASNSVTDWLDTKLREGTNLYNSFEDNEAWQEKFLTWRNTIVAELRKDQADSTPFIRFVGPMDVPWLSRRELPLSISMHDELGRQLIVLKDLIKERRNG